jgi:hypothetical protein
MRLDRRISHFRSTRGSTTAGVFPLQKADAGEKQLPAAKRTGASVVSSLRQSDAALQTKLDG